MYSLIFNPKYIINEFLNLASINKSTVKK